jgi:hypothetical protein
MNDKRLNFIYPFVYLAVNLPADICQKLLLLVSWYVIRALCAELVF